MVQRHSAVVVGAGSQGWVHARAYRALDGTEPVAVVDVDPAAADSLAAELAIPVTGVSFREVLETLRPEIVSVCTPVALHPEVVRAAVEAGARAVHCEKPIASSYADALAMARLARDAGVQLTVNLQRRLDPVHRFARERLEAGAVGEVVSIEGYCPNLFDWGTHILDLIGLYRGDAPAESVMGQVDVSIDRYVYDARVETSSITQVRWADGVTATVSTGREPWLPVLNAENNLGLIVQGTRGRLDSRGARCRIRTFDGEETVFDSPFGLDAGAWPRGVDPAIVACTEEAIANLVASLESGDEPATAVRHGLAASELIFATYESSRSRARVSLPLGRHDNALLSGLAEGYWNPVGELRSSY